MVFSSLIKMKKIPKKSLEQGKVGENFVEQHCQEKNILYKKATRSEDLKEGIDCYINEIPTDVKNTKDIFLCQVMRDSGLINTRHPFKSSSKSTHYYFVNVKPDLTGELIEHISINEKLLRDFIKSEEDLIRFKNYLASIDTKHISEFGVSETQAIFKIKQVLISFCKPNVNISYNDPAVGVTEVSFKLCQSKVKTTVAKESNTQSILERFKNKSSTSSPVEIKKENIIVIEI